MRTEADVYGFEVVLNDKARRAKVRKAVERAARFREYAQKAAFAVEDALGLNVPEVYEIVEELWASTERVGTDEFFNKFLEKVGDVLGEAWDADVRG